MILLRVDGPTKETPPVFYRNLGDGMREGSEMAGNREHTKCHVVQTDVQTSCSWLLTNNNECLL